MAGVAGVARVRGMFMFRFQGELSYAVASVWVEVFPRHLPGTFGLIGA